MASPCVEISCFEIFRFEILRSLALAWLARSLITSIRTLSYFNLATSGHHHPGVISHSQHNNSLLDLHLLLVRAA